MKRFSWSKAAIAIVCVVGSATNGRAELRVSTDFEGGSAANVEIDQAARTIRFAPGGDPVRGWPCWWYFRVDGIAGREPITVQLRGSQATVDEKTGPLTKPLSNVWAMPKQATFSVDGRTWLHTEEGRRDGDWMIYSVTPDGASCYVAWGPPYTPRTATESLTELARNRPFAKVTELCRSRQDRAVPMLVVREGDRPTAQRFGVWIQARQHAWESGSSWVAQGFAEWLTGDEPEAAWFRQHTETYLVPIMDVDNTATGNGGKEARPQDHNRDWSDEPHWNEVRAAQKHVVDLIQAGRMDLFVDLHNPGPGDPTFFPVLDKELLKEPMIGLRDRFMELGYARISKTKPFIPMSNKPKSTGASYHPLWRQISANWVSLHGNPHTVSVCLETIWNYKSCTTEGYRAVGANLGRAARDYFMERLKDEG